MFSILVSFSRLVCDIFAEGNSRLSPADRDDTTSSSPSSSSGDSSAKAFHNTFSGDSTKKPSSVSIDHSAPRRFISSILGGDIPYGARGHVLTQAQRKEYPSIKRDQEEQQQQQQQQLSKESNTDSPNSLIVKDKELIPTETPISLKSPVPPAAGLEPVVRCSVIQRTPAAVAEAAAAAAAESSSPSSPKHIKDIDVTLPAEQQPQQHLEPEQDQPIDYHVPKRKDDSAGDEKELKYRVARRTRPVISRPLGSMWGDSSKLSGIMSAAAGHGRTNGSSQQQNGGGSGQQGQNGNNGGGSSNYGGGAGNNGGAGSSSNGGNMGGPGSGGTGSGGMGGGRDGRSNYGPNSPPTGSLPPFYETMKGVNGTMNAYNAAANANFMAQNTYNNMVNTNVHMDCDTTQEFTNLGAYSAADVNVAAKQYSMLQNAAYGIVLKDEIDLDYDSKSDLMNNMNGHMMQGNNYNGLDVNDGMMDDIGNVDPLQFTATFVSSPNDHGLFDNLSAVDLSSFLQRLPNDDHSSPGNDLEISSTPSLTPDSVSVTAADNCMESFPEILMARGANNGNNGYDRNMYGLHNGGSHNNRFMHHDNPPSYQQSREMQQLLQQQQMNHGHGNGHLHEQLSISNGINYEIDSHSNMSLPSPSSGSMDAPPDAKPIIQSVSTQILLPTITIEAFELNGTLNYYSSTWSLAASTFLFLSLCSLVLLWSKMTNFAIDIFRPMTSIIFLQIIQETCA